MAVQRYIVNVLNLVQVFGWSYAIYLILVEVAKDPHVLSQEGKNPFGESIFLIRRLQVLEVTDLLFTLLGLATGSVGSVFIQLFARLVTAWIYLNSSTNALTVAIVIIAWGLADSIRYL